MPSRIEELIAEFRAVRANYGASSALGVYNSGKAYAYEMCAQKLERAYREEVVPMVKMFYRLKVEAAYAKQFVDNSLAAADLEKAIEDSAAVLRRFDAPAGTEPPANPKPAAVGCEHQLTENESDYYDNRPHLSRLCKRCAIEERAR